MKRDPAWRRYLRVFGADPAADVDDELEFHLAAKIDELIAAGYPASGARQEALRQFGPMRPIRQECARISLGSHVQASRAEYFAGWGRDVRYAARSLGRTRVASFAAILILAAGIGANTAVFTLLDRLVWAPLPVPHPNQLVMLSVSDSPPGLDGSYSLTDAEFERLRDHNQVLSGLGAEANVNIRERRQFHPTQANAADGRAVSANFFEVLQVRAQSGRLLASSDQSQVAVISDRFWSQRFARAADAIGQVIYLEKLPFTIVGVLPRGFFGLHRGNDSDVYIPLASVPTELRQIFREGRWLRLFGRSRPGVSLPQVQANLQGLMERGERIESRTMSAGTPGTWGEQRRSLALLEAIAAVLLLIGCANVGCLLLARGAARRQEMAVRLALGAKRTRVVRQSVLESVLLALAGGGVGLLLAPLAQPLLLTAFRWQDRPLDLSMDWRTVGFVAMVSLASAILFGIIPAMQLWRGGRLLLSQQRGLTSRLGAGRFLVIAEVGLSLVLVAGAAVFIRSFENLRAIPIGFSTDRISYIELGSTKDPDSPRAPFEEARLLADSIARAPGVEGVALADLLTFSDGGIQFEVRVPENPGVPEKVMNLLRVDPGYFDALRIQLRMGRNFTSSDDAHAPRVAILSEGTARRLFQGQNPIGKRILLGRFRDPKPEDATEIVGVVNDVKFSSVTAPAPDVVFQPVMQGVNNSANTSTLKLHVRSGLSTAQVAALVQSRIADFRMPVSVDSAAPLENAISRTMLNDRIRMQASSIFGVLALLLITAGIYGLMAYSVVMRTREIGIRVAIGSRPSEIVGLVLRQGMRLTMWGVVVGMPGVVLVMRAVSKLVFGLSPIDWASVAIAVLILCATGILASVGPAWRAARLDPVEALRVQ